jgi:hypothetical protein
MPEVTDGLARTCLLSYPPCDSPPRRRARRAPQNWDGSGGNGAAMRHFEATGCKYPLVAKLGTITPSGGLAGGEGAGGRRPRAAALVWAPGFHRRRPTPHADARHPSRHPSRPHPRC